MRTIYLQLHESHSDKVYLLRWHGLLCPKLFMISLYKAYVLPNLEYCCPLFLGISKVLKNNIERTNHYAIKTLLNLGNSATYDFCLAMADMDKQKPYMEEYGIYLHHSFIN